MRPHHMLSNDVSAWVDLDHIQVIGDVKYQKVFPTELCPPAGFHIQYAFRDFPVLYGTGVHASEDDIASLLKMHRVLLAAWRSEDYTESLGPR